MKRKRKHLNIQKVIVPAYALRHMPERLSLLAIKEILKWAAMSWKEYQLFMRYQMANGQFGFYKSDLIRFMDQKLAESQPAGLRSVYEKF